MRHPHLTAARRANSFSYNAETALMSALYRTNRLRQAARLAVARVVSDLLRPVFGSSVDRLLMVGGSFAAGPRSLESLENRQLMSAGSITFSNGLLTVSGPSDAGSAISVQPINSSTTFTANTGDGHLYVVPRSAVTSIVINGGTGADNIYADTAITVPVTINGNGGNDTVRGGGGANTILLGDGNAFVLTRGTASYVKTGNGNVTLQGSTGNDTLIGGNGSNYIDGGPGNDSLTTGNGNSTLMGEAGNDTLVAGNGTDVLNGGLGNDSLVTGAGTDTVYPSAGTNTVVEGSAKTTVDPTDGGVNTITTATGSVVGTPASSPTPTPTSTGTVATGWTTYAGSAASGGSPQAVIQVQDPAVMTNTGVVVRGLNSVLGAGSPIDANFAWNFGDASGTHNTLEGFNASHVYANPGTYTVTLTVTNVNGKTSTASAQVTIAADTRRAIYVNSVSGNDANNGSTTSLAVRTVARAVQLLGDNTELLFARGQTFNFAAGVGVTWDNVLVGAYGSGAQPVLNFTNPVAGSAFFWTFNTTAQFTVQDVTFTTLLGVNFSSVATPPVAVSAAGYDITVQRCTFAYMSYGVDASGAPVGLNVFDDVSPNADGLDGYFVWGQGSDLVLVGNSAASSVGQHIFRTLDTSEVLVADNDFTNLDGKGCIEIQAGSYAWVSGNTVTGGDIRVGPRGGPTEAVTTVTAYAVIQDNTVINNWIAADAGSEHIMIRNNVIDTSLGKYCIVLTGQDNYGRQSADIRVFNNTGIESQNVGTFLTCIGYVNGVQLVDNLYVDPTMYIGAGGTAPVYVIASDLSGWTLVTNNVWQTPAGANLWSQGGINFVGTSYVQSGEQTAGEWNALPQVGTDLFSATSINYTTFAPAANSVAATAGVAVAGVSDDMYGNARTGTLSVGAVEVA